TKDIHEVSVVKDICLPLGMTTQEATLTIEKIGKAVEKHSGNRRTIMAGVAQLVEHLGAIQKMWVRVPSPAHKN
ncbi:hypothetical protein LCGC14_2283790, partial [marine sediment metagenome]